MSETIHGPEWRESWALSYRDPVTKDAIDFLRASSRERLDAAARTKHIPLLADIHVSRLIATLDALGVRGGT